MKEHPELRQLLTVPRTQLRAFVPRLKKKSGKDRSIHEGGVGTVYVLRLEHGMWYVGITENLERRMKEHFTGRGSRWTKLHRPVELVESRGGTMLLETSLTMTYMARYGWENVRGAAWTEINLSIPPQTFRTR